MATFFIKNPTICNGGIFNNHFNANLPRNLLVKKIVKIG